MNVLAESASRLDRSVAWIWNMLREELAPFPGRAQIVTRIVISAVLLMLIVMTFRIPGAALGGYYTLLLSRESPRATLHGGVELTISFLAGAAFVLISAFAFFGSPVLHFIWVIGSFFLIFFVIRTLKSYSSAAGFGFLIATCIPIWDRLAPLEVAVEATLWTCANVALGAAVSIAVEYLFARYSPRERIEQGLAERWDAVANVLDSYAVNGTPGVGEARLHHFALLGVSNLRRTLLRSDLDLGYAEREGAIIFFTEHLVDLAAALTHLRQSPDEEAKRRLHLLATQLHAYSAKDRSLTSADAATSEWPSSTLPLLPQMERTAQMIAVARAGSPVESDETTRTPDLPPQTPLFVEDAFTNGEHLVFALKGCLAASLCYVFYNAVGWPGLNTSVATCIVTALSSIGSSRQKQVLRVSGAIAGGFIFGMGSQVLLLTHMDSVAGFAVLFAVVCAIAGWISTAGPRISYFGLQIALAFFLINLQEPAFQTSLTIARDRVMGILLGLLAMWLVFDLMGGIPAAEQMVRSFKSSLNLLAELQELSLAPDAETIAKQVRHTRSALVGRFAAMNAEADAVLLETGKDRESHLALRDKVLDMQTSLRSLLLLQVTTLQYRRQRLIHHLPEPIARAQARFDGAVVSRLRLLAEGRPAESAPISAALSDLRAAITTHYGATATEVPTRANAVLALSNSVTQLVNSLSPL